MQKYTICLTLLLFKFKVNGTQQQTTYTNKAYKYPSRPTDIFESEIFRYGNLSIGKSVNLFPTYGLAALSFKVFPNARELFKEKTRYVFYPDSYTSRSVISSSSNKHNKYDDYLLIDFCDTTDDLLSAYFDHFYIDGIPTAHKTFTSLLSIKDKSEYLGILPPFFDDRHSFVLTRLFRRKRKEIITGDKKRLLKPLRRDLKMIKSGSRNSALNFFDKYGTHVITEYEIGDSMYQVFVFSTFYNELKRNFRSNKSKEFLSNFNKYFSPYYALHVGNVKLASGNEKFKNMIASKLQNSYLFHSYQSIFKIFKESYLEQELETLEGEVILGLKLEKITSKLPKGLGRRRLSEALDNTLALYYVNLQ